MSISYIDITLVDVGVVKSAGNAEHHLGTLYALMSYSLVSPQNRHRYLFGKCASRLERNSFVAQYSPSLCRTCIVV
jgi:hypothetical protein